MGFAQTIYSRGVPTHLRSDNDPGFIACQLHQWVNRLGVRTLFIEPGSRWENGYIESSMAG
jgi:putative transposase